MSGKDWRGTGPPLLYTVPSPHDPMSLPAAGSPDLPRRDPRDHDSHRLLGLHAHSWVLANINMADNKAAFVVFGAAALGAYLRPDVGAWLRQPVWEAAPLVRVLAMLLMVAGSVCAVIVVAPRSFGHGRSLTFWGGIAEHEDMEEYVDAVEGRSSQELGRALLEQVFIISQLAVRKYRWLRWSVWLVGSGFLLVLVAALLP